MYSGGSNITTRSNFRIYLNAGSHFGPDADYYTHTFANLDS